MCASSHANEKIKKPNVSGQFYESDPKRLASHIDHFFKKADVSPFESHIDVVIAPHAGYIYSGSVAAYGFKSVSKHQYKTIVILAPSHYVGFDGISVWEEGGFETPLGVAQIDNTFTKKLIDSSDKVYFHEEAFSREHSLEVEIPFLQETFSDFKIVPVVMGQPSIETLQDFARTLNEVIGKRQDVLVVVSTDLSHYHDDSTARKMDEKSIKAIEALDVIGLIKGYQDKTMEMCGFIPVVTAVLYANEKGLKTTKVLEYANSGDVSGDRNNVVGYTAILIYNGDKAGKGTVGELSMDQKKRLMEIAKGAILEYIKSGTKMKVKESDPRLNEEEGAFVTIRKSGYLRGCIGNVLGSGPLYLTVRDMAIKAASEDPRFNPVSAGELENIDIEVSVLSKPWKVKTADEIELGVHGVILSQGLFKSGLYLPEVATQTGWSKEKFLSSLASEKAGLPPDAWKDPKTKIEIFKTTKFSEEDLK